MPILLPYYYIAAVSSVSSVTIAIGKLTPVLGANVTVLGVARPHCDIVTTTIIHVILVYE